MKKSNKILLISILIVFGIMFIAALVSRMNTVNLFAAKEVVVTPEVVNSNNASANTVAVLPSKYGNFTKIRTEGGIRLEAIRTNNYSVAIYGSDEAVRNTEIQIFGDTLAIKPKRECWSCGFQTVKVAVSLPQLQSMEINGAAKAYFQGFDADKFTIDISGASEVVGKNNKVNNLSVDSSGSSKINLQDSLTTNVHLDLSGASKIFLNMAGGELSGNASGASEIRYRGKISDEFVDLSGSSTIKHERE